MKVYKLSYVGVFLGILGMTFTVYRYLILFYDPSQAFIFFVLSGILWVFAYIYSALRYLNESLDERIEDLKKDVESNHKYLNDVLEPQIIRLNKEQRE